jgi:chromosome segregation ATPase
MNKRSTPITPEDVAAATERIRIRKESPTVERIRAELGNRGSSSTILKYRQQLEKEEVAEPSTTNGEALKAFTVIWKEAFDLGEASRNVDLENLRDDLESVKKEAEKEISLREKAEENLELSEVKIEKLVDDLSSAQKEASEARALEAKIREKLSILVEELRTTERANAQKIEELLRERAEKAALQARLEDKREELEKTQNTALEQQRNAREELQSIRKESAVEFERQRSLTTGIEKRYQDELDRLRKDITEQGERDRKTIEFLQQEHLRLNQKCGELEGALAEARSTKALLQQVGIREAKN